MTYRAPKGGQYAEMTDTDLREVYRHWRGVARYACRTRPRDADKTRERLALALQEIVAIEGVAKDRQIYL